jgi:VanZ family protein
VAQERKPQYWGALLWAGFIFATSSGVVTIRQLSGAVTKVSGPVSVSQAGFESVWKSVWWIFVKGWHATEFALLAWLLYKVLSTKPKGLQWAAGVAAGYALFDELHQVYVAGRGGRMSDVLIDWVGIGIYFAFFHMSWTKPRKILALVGAMIVIFLLSIFPTPTFPLPWAPESHRFNP